jgi:hypothetical protein
MEPTTRDRSGPGIGRHDRGGVVLTSEFASVRVSVDTSANGPRLLVEDLEGAERVYLDPLELASLCQATDSDRRAWLFVGPYRDERP